MARSATTSAWAEWRPAAPPWTVGVEEQVMLVEPERWRPVWRAAEAFATLPSPLRAHVSLQTHACVVELTTDPRRTAGGAAGQLAVLRRGLQRALAPTGVRAAVAGTHPSAVWSKVEVTRDPRYRRVHASMRALAEREPTFALHVHVGVPDADLAVRALDGLREDLPLLLALGANSPFLQGRDTGLASARAPMLAMFPRCGIARRFGTYGAWVDAVGVLIRTGAIPGPGSLWWDARLQPRFGTVEVRIMDAQTRVRDTAGLAALVQSLVRLHAGGEARRQALTPEALAENRFLAARDGIAAEFVCASRPRRARAADLLFARLDECVPVARALGCDAELELAGALADSPGHARQRATARGRGLPRVVAALQSEFAAGAAYSKSSALVASA